MSTQANIETYIGHFRGEHEQLRQVASSLHRKILVVTMLDALARGRFPKERYPQLKSRERYMSLVEEHSTWRHAKLVSTSELAMMIEERGGADACKLTDEFMKRLGTMRHRPWQAQGLDVDPTPDELLLQTPNEHERKIVDEVKHSSLLYEFRCVLAHEYRNIGHGFEFNESDTEPFYHTLTHRCGRETRELVYPTGWFLELVPPILDSLAAYYVKKNYDPGDSYEFGSPWRKKRRH